MTSLILSLGPSALIRLHDVLICLSKFSDTVALEAENDLVSILYMKFALRCRTQADVNVLAPPVCSQLHKNSICIIRLYESVLFRDIFV